MRKIQVMLPDSIHERAKELAQEEGISMNNFIVTSVSNEVVRQETRDFFRRAAIGFDSRAFADALAAVPDVPAQPSDEL